MSPIKPNKTFSQTSVVSKLPASLNVFGDAFVTQYYHAKCVFLNSYGLSLVTENKMLKYLNQLGVNKSTGLDGIPSRFVKDSASVITCPLTHIVNLSLIHGTVPDDLKSARVVPIFKKNDKTEVDNYRPVSVLCVISKVFERVVYD